MIEGKVIEILDTHNEGTLVSTLHLLIWILTPLIFLVGYYSAKMPTGITNRDFCNQRAWRASKDKGK
jgi:hypothetical protein